MCGICGYTGEKRDGLTGEMMESIAHRGPDDRGEYSDGTMHMGMTRLSIIDPDTGHQPISDESGKRWVVCNGEIFNYIELRKTLEALGHRFTTRSDTETIIHAYEEYGDQAPHKLNGMFGIAIWDDLEKKLTLLRDRYGVKPLYYAFIDGELIFGSEIKAALKHPKVSRQLDYEALSHYFALRNIPSPFTIYKNIRSLPPGYRLVWQGGTIRIERWYHLSMEPEYCDADEDRLVETLDDILRDSVRLRLRSDVDYGAYLSGGIDSSLVVAIMSEFSPKPVKTFCLTYTDTPKFKQDGYYARKVARQYGTEHHEYVMDWSELEKELPSIVSHMDQPFAGVIASFWLSRFMKQHVSVALSGDGADDLFASYGHHRLVGPISATRKALQEGRSLAEIDYSFFKGREEFVQKLARYEPWEARLAYAAFMEHEKSQIFSDKGRALMGGYATSKFVKGIYDETPDHIDELNKTLYLDIKSLLPNEVLHFNDMLSMANSLEVRTPFLDYRIAELACSIPGSLKIRNNTLKYILRKVAARYLPKDILERPKEGFVLPKNQWLRVGMADTMKSVLCKERLAIHGLIDHDHVSSLSQKFMAGDDTLTFKVWSLIVFQIWYEDNVA